MPATMPRHRSSRHRPAAGACPAGGRGRRRAGRRRARLLRDLGIRVGDGVGGRGLRLSGGATATRVAVSAPAGAAGATGVGAVGGLLRDLDVSLGASSLALQLTDGEVDGGRFEAAGGTAISVEQAPGLAASRLHGLRASGQTALMVTHGRATVDSALLRGSGQSAVVQVANSNAISGELRAILRQVTIVGDGRSTLQRGVEVRASSSGQHASAKLLDTIVAAVKRPLVRAAAAGDANIVTDHVAHGPLLAGDDPADPSRGTLSETAVLDVDPGFADLAGGDLRLRPGSPLIDAGRPDPLDIDEAATDLAGAARVSDGNGDGVAIRDLGAYESPAVAPPAPPAEPPPGPGEPATPASAPPASPAPAPPAAATPGADRRAPRLARLRLRGGARPRLTGRLDEPGRVTVTIRHGRRVVKTVTVSVRRAGAFTVTLPPRLRPGRYALAVRAADAAGNRSRATALRLLRRAR